MKYGEASDGDRVQLVLFRIADQLFGLNVFDVERVIRYDKGATLPQSPDYLDGVMPFGDDVIPVMDLRKRFEVPVTTGDGVRVIVVSGGFGRVGLVVDAAMSLQAVPANDVLAPPAAVRGITADYIAGIVRNADKPIVVLAIEKLVSATERIAMNSVEVGASDD